jgi:hypothetical protein
MHGQRFAAGERVDLTDTLDVIVERFLERSLRWREPRPGKTSTSSRGSGKPLRLIVMKSSAVEKQLYLRVDVEEGALMFEHVLIVAPEPVRNRQQRHTLVSPKRGAV